MIIGKRGKKDLGLPDVPCMQNGRLEEEGLLEWIPFLNTG